MAHAGDLGFDPPPAPLTVKLLRAGPQWTLFVQAIPPGPIGQAAAWLEPHSPVRMTFAANHVLRVEFDTVPAVWREAFQDVELDTIRLDPDGSATVSVRGSRAGVAAFAARLEEKGHTVDLKLVSRTRRPAGLLTPSQDEAIRMALACGYYDIPRPLNLHQLAAKLGVTSASLSERLRRAEGRIIKQYANGGPSPSDETTARPSPAPAPPGAADIAPVGRGRDDVEP